jgi:hypothetical protein
MALRLFEAIDLPTVAAQTALGDYIGTESVPGHQLVRIAMSPKVPWLLGDHAPCGMNVSAS